MARHGGAWWMAASLLVLPATAASQTSDQDPCSPAVAAAVPANGGRAGQLALGAGRLSVDTIYVLDTESRSWSGRDVAASAGVAVGGMHPASWRACVGARAMLRRAEVEVRGVQGEVRIRASLQPLAEALRSRRADSSVKNGSEEP